MRIDPRVESNRGVGARCSPRRIQTGTGGKSRGHLLGRRRRSGTVGGREAILDGGRRRKPVEFRFDGDGVAAGAGVAGLGRRPVGAVVERVFEHVAGREAFRVHFSVEDHRLLIDVGGGSHGGERRDNVGKGPDARAAIHISVAPVPLVFGDVEAGVESAEGETAHLVEQAWGPQLPDPCVGGVEEVQRGRLIPVDGVLVARDDHLVAHGVDRDGGRAEDWAERGFVRSGRGEALDPADAAGVGLAGSRLALDRTVGVDDVDVAGRVDGEVEDAGEGGAGAGAIEGPIGAAVGVEALDGVAGAVGDEEVARRRVHCQCPRRRGTGEGRVRSEGAVETDDVGGVGDVDLPRRLVDRYPVGLIQLG